MTHVDRNLLFGILAVQMDFVGRDALIAAMHAWLLERSKPLGRILVEQQALSPARYSLLEQLVDEYLAAHDGDAEKSLAAAGGVGPIRDDLQHIADSELHATLDRIVAHGDPTARGLEATMTFGEDSAATDGSRFRILRPHARGGLGQVSVALDSELKREVALKELRPERADDPSSRARFLLEAEVTGRLEHPGVVPVYGLGSDAEGRPFYAMRLVKGESLKEAIERFHTTESGGTSDPRRWSLELRRLLNQFVAVCNVVAYAHSRGVIHRDLKPANIMLGPYGETLVVDWGLAKVVGRGEAAASGGTAEATLQPASGSGSSETLPGTALGTPAYMSPEQSEGRLEEVGPLSDLYSLGATLFCLLTGRPPIEESDVAAALRRVQRGEIPPPRAVNPRVPRALEAICLKAMASRPEGRYASPRALADDLERWLADEAVAVYRDPLTTRLTRWGRRHRTAAVGIGVLLVTAVAALAISTGLISSEQSRTRREFRRAERHLAAANEKAELLKWEDYVNRIGRALLEIEADGNVILAERLLDGCPTDLRGWEWHYVRRLCHLARSTYRGHNGHRPGEPDRPDESPFPDRTIRGVAFSPDGTWVASAAGKPYDVARNTSRAEIRLWDIATGRDRLASPLGGLIGTVQSVAISPDGTLVAAGGGYYHPDPPEGWLALWDAATGRQKQIVPVPGMAVTSVAFSPDGKALAVGSGDCFGGHPGRWSIRDLPTLAPLTDEHASICSVTGLAFSLHSERIAVSGKRGVEVWDRTTDELVGRFDEVKNCNSVAFSPDGRWIAAGCMDRTVRLYHLATGAEPRILYGHKGFVYGVAFSPDSTLLTSVGEDRSVRLWEVATGRELGAFHGHAFHVFSVAFHPDGRRIASGGSEGVVKIWDVVQSRPTIHNQVWWVTGIAFHKDGRRVATESARWRMHEADGNPQLINKNQVRFEFWDMETGEAYGSVTSPDAGPDHGPLSCWPLQPEANSPDGRWTAKVVPGGPDQVQVTEKATGRSFSLTGHTGGIMHITFSPDSRRIATSSDDRTVKLWDTESGREVLTLRGHTASVLCAAFSPEGDRLVSGSVDRTARVWDARPPGPDTLPAHRDESP
jgi:WD40 repeat protein/serine/threonine protein kinase